MADDKTVAASQPDTQEALKQRLLAAEARILKLKHEKKELKSEEKEVPKEEPAIEQPKEEVIPPVVEAPKETSELETVVEELRAINEELIKTQSERNTITNVATGSAIEEDPPTGNTRTEEQAWKEMSVKRGWDDSYKQLFLNNYRAQNGTK